MEASAVTRYPANVAVRAAEFIRRHALTFALLLPFAVCAPLLSHRGLFEFGDANFPLHPFPLDFVLPWQSTSDGGVDNVLIGLPRIAYYGGINLVELISFTLQLAQWLWYSAMLALGVFGGTLLARRLGAGSYGVLLGIFWALNVWSYDRVSQGPLFLAYQALPIAIFLFLRYLDTGRLNYAVVFGLSTFLLTPSLQMAYIAAFACAGIAVYMLATRPQRLSIAGRIAVCGLIVGLFNAYFLSTLLADVRLNSHNSLGLVRANFSNGTFIDYSARATLGNALQLGAFFYSTLDQQPYPVHTAAWLPFVALLCVIAQRSLWRQPRFWTALALFVLGVWLVSGVTLTQSALLGTRAHIPGLSSFVEPDYLTPIIVLGYLVVLSFGALQARTTYGTVWKVGIWLLVAGGVAAYLPWFRPLGGLPQTPIPNTYLQYAHSTVEPRVLWIPTIWVSRYRWSPYTLNGFNALNSPSDYMGPYMLEWVSPNSRAMIDTLVDEIRSANRTGFVGLAQALGIRNIAVSADELDPYTGENSENVREMRPILLDVARSHIGTSPSILRDGESRVITQHLLSSLPMAGVYQSPVSFNGGYQFLGDAIDALIGANAYVPIVLDDRGSGRSRGRLAVGALVAQPGIAPPPLANLKQQKADFTLRADTMMPLTKSVKAVRDCTDAGRFVKSIRDGSAITLNDRRGHVLCASATVLVNPRVDRNVEARFGFSAQRGSRPQVQFVLLAHRHDALFIDVSDHSMQRVPAWAQKLQIIFYGTSRRVVRYTSPALLRWSYHGFALSGATKSQCAGSFQRLRAGMSFRLDALVNGDCSVVLRQSFSTLWAARVVNGRGTVGNHVPVDGYANAWELRGHGPVTLEVYNKLLAPFTLGVWITGLSFLLAIVACIIPVLRIRKRL